MPTQPLPSSQPPRPPSSEVTAGVPGRQGGPALPAGESQGGAGPNAPDLYPPGAPTPDTAAPDPYAYPPPAAHAYPQPTSYAYPQPTAQPATAPDPYASGARGPIPQQPTAPPYPATQPQPATQPTGPGPVPAAEGSGPEGSGPAAPWPVPAAGMPAAPAPGMWKYAPRRSFWESPGVRAGALFTLIAVCGVVILAVVRHHIGTEAFLVGLALAVLPVPLMVWLFVWLDRVSPSPWQNIVFAFSWGACAATLVALFANEYGAKLLATTFSGTAVQTDRWGATFVAPLVEETAKGAAVLLLFTFRRRQFASLLDGIVISGLVATGFAFTENILYLGTAFSADRALGVHGLGATTFGTFFARVLMTPFAHPLFTSMTGMGFALAAVVRPGLRWRWRWLPPVVGWLLAMTLHGTWNGTSQTSPLTFLTVYVAVMIPVFGLVVWLAFWARSGELRTVRTTLPAYTAAGWFTPAEPLALASMKIRGEARRVARRFRGEPAARAVREYAAFAMDLAFLRHAAVRGAAAPDYAAREGELLHHLWQRRAAAQPALLYAARPPAPIWRPLPQAPTAWAAAPWPPPPSGTAQWPQPGQAGQPEWPQPGQAGQPEWPQPGQAQWPQPTQAQWPQHPQR